MKGLGPAIMDKSSEVAKQPEQIASLRQAWREAEDAVTKGIKCMSDGLPEDASTTLA